MITLVALVLATLNRQSTEIKTLKSQNQLQQRQHQEQLQDFSQRFEQQLEQKQQEVEQLKRERDEAKRQAAARRAARLTSSVAPTGSWRQVQEQWRPLVAKYFGANTNVALAIMIPESGGNPRASSPTNDHGLFQINKGLAIYGEQIYDPEFNIKVAYEQKFLKGGWRHWTVFTNGSYRRYL